MKSNEPKLAKKPTKVCILACAFWPIYPGWGGRQPFVVAETLARAGYRVSVVTTFPIDDEGGLPKHKPIVTENLNGIQIIRIPTLRLRGQGQWKKFIHQLSFSVTSLIALPFIGKCDVIFGLHPVPLMLLLPGFLFSRIWGSRYIIRVTDLWPDVLFDFNILKSRPAKKVITFLVTATYRLADHIMAFTPKIKQEIMKYGIPEEKISVIEVTTDTLLFRPIPDTKNESASLGFPSLDSKFVVLYSGAYAVTYDFDTFLEAAKALEHLKSIFFVLLGDGVSKKRIMEKVKDLQLKNAIVLPGVSKAELVAKYINCSDVCVIPLKPEMVTGMTTTRPAKTFEFWACGKPVISCSKGELTALIEESQAGISLEPGNPKALAEAIEFLYLNRHVAVDMGNKGREFVLSRFSCDVLETNLKQMFRQVIP